MRLALTLALGILLSATSIAADDRNFSMTEGQIVRLSAPARALYVEAQEQVDRVNYDEAVRILAAAAEIDTTHDGLQFLVARLAFDRAEVHYSRETMFAEPMTNADAYTKPAQHAEPFFEIAENALSRLSVSQTLDPGERSRLQSNLDLLREKRNNLETRDRERLETALAFVQIIHEERRAVQLQGVDTTGDNIDPFQTYSAESLRRQEALRRAAEQPNPLLAIPDPFAPLPGEFRPFFLPPPPEPPAAPAAAQPGFDGFADPFGEDPTMFGEEPRF